MTEPALRAPARRRRQRRRERRAMAIAAREEATAPTTTRREREQPSTTHRVERASCRHGRMAGERHVAASAAAPPCMRQELQYASKAPQAAASRASRDSDRPREEATAPTITRREHEQPSTTHRAQRASRRRERVAAECHAAAGAAPRPSQHQERQHGAAGSGAASVVRQRPPQRGSDRDDDHTQRARAADHHAPL